MKGYKEQRDAENVLKRAKLYLDRKNYRKAIEELERVKLRDVEVYLMLAEAYESLGNRDKAEEYFEKARFLDTDIRSKEKVKRGVNLISMRNLEEAEKELKKAIELNPFEAEAYLELYKLYKSKSGYRKAIEVLKLLLTVEPFKEFAYVELSNYYFMIRDFRSSIKLLERALSLFESPRLRFELAKAYQGIGKLEEAEENLKIACQVEYRNLEYRQKLAEVLAFQKRYDDALQVLFGALEIYPDAVYVIQSIANLYHLMGDEELAELYLRFAISKAEGFVREDARKHLSEYLIEIGKLDKAEEELVEIIESSDNTWLKVDAFVDLSLILMEQGRSPDIVLHGKKLLRSRDLTDEEFCEVAEIVADALLDMGSFTDALRLYRKVLSYSSNEKVIKRCYSQCRQLEEIISLENMWNRT